MDAGLLSIDEVCSPIQMILDNELMSALKRYTHEFEVNEETIGLETILETGPGGHFLDKPHTGRHFRDEHWRPDIWSRRMLGPWLAEDHRLDVDVAREQALSLQAEMESRGTDPVRISESLEKDLLRVIESARTQLQA